MSYPDPSVRVEPAIDLWSPGYALHAIDELIERINRRAARLGTARLDTQPTRLIATGHQAQLWHPGILAKDIAMGLAAERFDARTLHIVVDQDVNDAWRLDLPIVEADQLRVRSMLLANQKRDVPTGYQPPADPQSLRDQLAAQDPPFTAVLLQSITDLPECITLAEQIAAVLARLKRPYAGDIPIMTVSDLACWPVYEAIVTRMLNDAMNCANAYNRAANAIPGAGITPLIVSRDMVELPLWAVRWNEQRRRVFVDLADSSPMFVFDDGEPIDRRAFTLLPRALMLTAVMRSAVCDLFIHGTGGLVYDRVTEAWWRDWTGNTLAPMAGATANLYMDPGAPVADRAQLDRAIWRRHHLPHNVDRELRLDSDAVREKRELIEHMQVDRDRARRRRAFNRIHQINDGLVEAHHGLVSDADRELDRARIGLQNAAIARRRDWCFALYPPDHLKSLRPMLAGHPVQCPT